MGSINPLTFFSPSSIIDYGQAGKTPNPSNNDVKQAFLKLLLEKIYLNNFMAASPEDNSNADSDVSIFNKDMTNTFVNDLFRQQVADQMVQSDALNLNNLGGAK